MNLSKEETVKLRRNRALDIRALQARHYNKFNFKDVCDKASLNYESTMGALRRLISNNDPHAISDEKLDQLEAAVVSLADSESNIEKASV